MKRLWLIVLIFMMGSILVACSGEKSSTNDGKVKIKYGLWDKNQVPAIEEIIKEFNGKNPNIEVQIEITPYSQYFQKLETAATGGALPDVIWMNGPRITNFATGNVLLPLDELIEKDSFDLKNYPESLVDLYTVEGNVYGIPKDFDTTALWYNKKLFDEAGVSYPDETWDWDTLKEAARKLTNKEKGVWGFAAFMGNQGGYYDLIWQNGGYIISEDGKSVGFSEPEAIEALKYNISFIEEGLSPTAAQMTETAPSNMLVSEKVAMHFSGPWMVPEYKENENLDVAVMPKGKERAVAIHGLANVIAKNTKHPEESWEFLKFLGSKEAAEIFAKTGTVIPAYNGTQEAWIDSVEHLHLQAYIDGAEYSHPLPSLKNTGALWEEETNILKKAWVNEISVEEATKELTESANKIINK